MYMRRKFMRSNLKYVIALFVCIVAVLSPAIAVKAEKKIPNPPITVTNVKLNGETFHAGDTLKYSFVIEDVGIDEFVKKYGEDWNFSYTKKNKGVHTVYACWKSSVGQTIFVTHKWKGTNNKNPKLTAKGEIPIKEGMRSGKWRLVFIELDMDTDSYLVIEDVDTNDYSDMKYDFVGTEFLVEGTKADVQAPSIKWNSLKLSKRAVKKNQKSKFSVKIKDKSDIEEVSCSFGLFKSGNNTKDYDKVIYGTMKYNKKKKRYEYNVKFDTTKYRKAQLLEIEVRDEFGNWKRYGGDHTYLDKRHYNAIKRMIVYSK